MLLHLIEIHLIVSCALLDLFILVIIHDLFVKLLDIFDRIFYLYSYFLAPFLLCFS